MNLVYEVKTFSAASIIGRAKCAAVFVHDTSPLGPFLLATVLMVRVGDSWILQNILVDDEHRRQGLASEIVLGLEKMYGHFRAAFVSPDGEAFARKFVERNGAREWQIGSVFTEQEFAALIGAAKAEARP